MSSTAGALKSQEETRNRTVTTLGGLGSISATKNGSSTLPVLSPWTSTSSIWSTGPGTFSSGGAPNSSRKVAESTHTPTSREPAPIRLAQGLSQDFQTQSTVKTGSGLLLDSSISDSWSGRPNSSHGPGFSRPRTSDRQPHTLNNGSHFPTEVSAPTYNVPAMATYGDKTYSSRPATVNLTAVTSAGSQTSNGIPVTNTPAQRFSEQPPAVYTKFGRSSGGQASGPTYLDSSKWSGTSSTRSPQAERSSFGDAQQPLFLPARNGSIPSSKHDGEQNGLDFGNMPVGGLPSMRSSNPAYTSPPGSTYFNDNIDNTMMQFGHMSLNGNTQSSSQTQVNGTHRSGSIAKTAYDHVNGNDAHSLHRSSDFRYGGYAQDTTMRGPRSFQTAYPSSAYAQQTQPVFPSANNAFGAWHASKGREDVTWSTDNLRRDSAQEREYQAQAVNHSYSNGQPGAMFDQRLRYNSLQVSNDQYMTYAMNEQVRQYLANLPSSNGHFSPSQYDMGAYMPLHVQSKLPSIESGRPDVNPPRGMRSILLDDFKNNRTRERYEIKDIIGHIAEFSGDQNGSRFMQTKLETANSDEKELVFQELHHDLLPLMSDVFGNYVIQKFFNHGTQKQKELLAAKMRGQVRALSQHPYACRVVQKAFDHVLTDQQIELVSELKGSVLICVKDCNGNHVIQKAIERCPPDSIRFILEAFEGQVHSLSTHSFGCRVIQRCLEHCHLDDKRMIMRELYDPMPGLVGDQYGNYVVQHVMQYGERHDRARVMEIVLPELEQFSMQKCASNVVEKCLTHGTNEWRRAVLESLMLGKRNGESMLSILIRDQYGNYVIQKLLEVTNRSEYMYLVDCLEPEIAKARRRNCGKQSLSIEKKMNRFGYRPPYLDAESPFYVRSNSTNTSPPPLTEDNSLQTSTLPSINGDAVEGAPSSRKPSDQSTEYAAGR